MDALENGQQDSVEQERLFVEALEQMKLGTRQYARRQVKWIRNKFLNEVRGDWSAAERDGREKDVHVYMLDATGREGMILRKRQLTEYPCTVVQTFHSGKIRSKIPLSGSRSLSSLIATCRIRRP